MQTSEQSQTEIKPYSFDAVRLYLFDESSGKLYWMVIYTASSLSLAWMNFTMRR